MLAEWGAVMMRAFAAAGAPRSPWSALWRDALLRRVVLRYVLARALLGLHTSVGTNPAHLPRCYPELPREVVPDAPDVVAGVARLAACLGRSRVFGKTALPVPSAHGGTQGG